MFIMDIAEHSRSLGCKLLKSGSCARLAAAAKFPVANIFCRDPHLPNVARVPIHFARHIHHNRQDNEERDGAHEQGIILLP